MKHPTIILKQLGENLFQARIPSIAPAIVTSEISLEDALTKLMALESPEYIIPEPSPLKQVILVRTGLGLRRGKEISQGAHASLAATLDYLDHPWVTSWLANSFTKIVLKVPSEEDLFAASEAAEAAGIPFSLIRDNGLTETHGKPTYIAAAVGPGPREEIDKITGSFSLY